jgi:hypothetical protein
MICKNSCPINDTRNSQELKLTRWIEANSLKNNIKILEDFFVCQFMNLTINVK